MWFSTSRSGPPGGAFLGKGKLEAESLSPRLGEDSGKVVLWGHYERRRAQPVGNSITRLFVAAACLALGGKAQGVGSQAQEKEASPATLYFFFTPECADAPEAARRARAFVIESRGTVRIRPVLLVRDFGRLVRTQAGDAFQLAMKELGELGPLDIPLYDEEGLRLAGHWEVDAVPAFVLLAGATAHRILGGRGDLREVLRCGK
jgi:hypothetical protein